MSPRTGARLAALPVAGYRPMSALAGDAELQVRFVAETGGQQRMFDFSAWPVSEQLQHEFARAFAQRTRPGGRIRSSTSAEVSFRILRSFARSLASGERSPMTSADLTAAHVKEWTLARNDHANLPTELAVLKQFLRLLQGMSDGFAACLRERNPSKKPSSESSYSRAELDRIMAAARADVRRAAARIRAGRALLHRWRTGGLKREPEMVKRRGRLLDVMDREADVPRGGAHGFAVHWVRSLGSMEEHFAMLHLNVDDIAAFVVLLTGLTGQNRSTILNAPAAHHRADGYAGGPAVAVVELDKPRRGRRRHMDLPLVDLPSWAPAPSSPKPDGQPDLHTPYGVYMLLHELAGPARRQMGSDKLIAWFSTRSGGGIDGFRSGLSSHQVADWARPHELLADPTEGSGPAASLNVTLRRLRLTFNEFQQRPVAHTERTLANDYLARNRGNITEYQQVVAAALAQQVEQARTLGRLSALSAEDVEAARTDPGRVAATHGMDAVTLERLLAGQLDTVLGACVDHTAGRHYPGQPCRASFMLCLSCPCARATPQHLPVQVLVHDQLSDRRLQMTPLRWTERYALAHAQLGNLLELAGAVAVADARAAITDDDRGLVTRFLRRELDLA